MMNQGPFLCAILGPLHSLPPYRVIFHSFFLVQVINNDGNHFFRYRYGEKELEQGRHNIRVSAGIGSGNWKLIGQQH